MPDEKTSPPQKNNTIAIILIVVGVLVILGAGGCVLTGYLAKKATQGFVSNATDGAIKVGDDGGSIKLSDGDTTINTGDAAKWPSGMPVDVPQPTFGKIIASSTVTSNKSWNITLQEVTADQFKSYQEAVKAKGWTSEGQTDFIISVASFKKDSWDLTVTHDPSSNGLSINLISQAN